MWGSHVGDGPQRAPPAPPRPPHGGADGGAADRAAGGLRLRRQLRRRPAADGRGRPRLGPDRPPPAAAAARGGRRAPGRGAGRRGAPPARRRRPGRDRDRGPAGGAGRRVRPVRGARRPAGVRAAPRRPARRRGALQPHAEDLGHDGAGADRPDPGVRRDGGDQPRRGARAPERHAGAARGDAAAPAGRVRRQGAALLRDRRDRPGDHHRRRHRPVRRAVPGLPVDPGPRRGRVPVRHARPRRADLDRVAEPGPGHPARDDDHASPDPAVGHDLPAERDGPRRPLDRLPAATHLLQPGEPRGDDPRRLTRVAGGAAGGAGAARPDRVRPVGAALPARPRPGGRAPRPAAAAAPGAGRSRGGCAMTATIRAGRWGADDLTVRYGAKLALDGVRLEVPDGYVSAGPGVYRDLTVDENLAFSGGAHGLRGQRLAGRADELLRRTGLLAARGRLGGQLSGGMRQKLALAMALLHEPDLLVLDAPTTGVDPVSRTELWRLLAHAAAGGAAVVLSTVYLDEAARAAAVLVLDEGRTLLAGPPGELVAATPGTVLDAPARPDGAEARGWASWRRGRRWRLWSADGSGLGAGAERVAPDLEDAVIIASLERRRDAEWKQVAA